MATKPLKSLKFPTLDDTYTVPQVDDTLTVQGAAADAKKVGDELTDIKGDISQKADYSFSYTTESGTGKYMNRSGAWKTDTRFYYIITDIIPCEPGYIFNYIGKSYVAASVLYYYDGVFVSAVNYNQRQIITIPDNVNGVRFQSANMSEAETVLTVEKIFPRTVEYVIEGETAKTGQVWTKTENGGDWENLDIDVPFFDRLNYVSIFEDESLYSLTRADGIAFFSRTPLPDHAVIERVRFKSASAGSGYIQIATTEFVDNHYMMNVKVYPVEYVSGWNEVEINFNTGDHSDYLLGFANLQLLYGDYTTLAGTIDTKYMFGNGLNYNTNSPNAIGIENVRYAFGSGESGTNYKLCFAFDADIYSGLIITELDELSAKNLPVVPNILRYKVKNGSVGYVGRWYDYTDNEDTYKVASAEGSYICFKVSGATNVSISWGGNFNADSFFSYKIDNGEYIRTEVDAEGNTIIIPDTNQHVLQVVMDAINVQNTWWTVGNGAGIRSVNTDGTLQEIEPTNKKIIFFGDSLTQGVRTLGQETTENPNCNSAVKSFGWYMSQYINANPLLVGYGDSGIGANGSFKKCIDAINYVVNGIETTDEEVDLIVINHGHNDTGMSSADFITNYNAVLDRFVTKYPGTPVLCVTPFNGRHAEDVKICAEARPSYCYFVDTYPLFLNRYYADGPGHLLAEGADICGKYLAQKALDFGIF